MAVHNELIKNFERIRAYMRDFYLYGFKTREGYERKIELFRAFQLGQDLQKIKLAIQDYRKPKINTESCAGR